jgi:hypothetical protein
VNNLQYIYIYTRGLGNESVYNHVLTNFVVTCDVMNYLRASFLVMEATFFFGCEI